MRGAAIEPRGLTKEQAAAYAGCDTSSAFDSWVRRGILPKPIPGTHRWDRKAIDAALDRASGLAAPSNDDLTPYQRWKADREGRAQGH
jgi:hypothetical protein